MSLSDTEREVYESHLKWLRDEEMALQTAHNKGVQEGIEKGRAEGLTTALQRLIDSGVSEADARKLLQLD